MAPGLMAAGSDISARVRRSDFIVPATCCLQVLNRNLVVLPQGIICVQIRKTCRKMLEGIGFPPDDISGSLSFRCLHLTS
jgi:hypothetical protein